MGGELAVEVHVGSMVGSHRWWSRLAIARHKPNFYIDLSGWAPKYFPPELVSQVNSVIPDKALFGSDSPSLPLGRWLAEFGELPFKPEVRPKIMLTNAGKLFGVKDALP